MKRNVLLCYPALSLENNEMHWFPFSLLPLAQALRNEGFNVQIVDRRIDKSSFMNIVQDGNELAFVGISSKTGFQISDGLDFAKQVRDFDPRIPIVWGGWHPTILPQETVEHELVDYVVTGRGERVIVELANALDGNHEISKVMGISYKIGQTSFFTGYRKASEIVDNAQQYHQYIDIERYLNPETMALGYFSGHGCVFNCAFCARRYMTNRYTPYDITKVISDLCYYKSMYGIKMVRFQDDNFFNQPSRALQIADGIIENDLNITWGANIRANVIPHIPVKVLERLIMSGMDSLSVGVESADEETLQVINKGIKPLDIIKTANILRDYHVSLKLSYIFGLPGDNLNKMHKTLDQVQSLKNEFELLQAYACFYQPYPGTELYKKAIAWGYPRFYGLEQWATMSPQSEIVNLPWLSAEENDLYQKEFYECGCFTAF